MAKKKTTRKKKAPAPQRKSKASASASAKPKRKVSKASKAVSKKKTSKASSRTQSGSNKKTRTSKKTKPSKKTTAKKKPVTKPKKSTGKSPSTASSQKKALQEATPVVANQQATTTTPAKKSGKSKSGKPADQTARPSTTRSATTPPGRKAGMLDPTPVHPNDAAHARSTPARLTRKQLNHFRDLLLKRRAELIGDVQAMESGALRGGGTDDSNHAPMHMADAGSDTFDQEFALQLAATERELLDEIDQSLQLIKDGTFGICEVTGKPISLPRLEAKPWAKVCIEVARERDRFHRMRH